MLCDVCCLLGVIVVDVLFGVSVFAVCCCLLLAGVSSMLSYSLRATCCRLRCWSLNVFGCLVRVVCCPLCVVCCVFVGC